MKTAYLSHNHEIIANSVEICAGFGKMTLNYKMLTINKVIIILY